MKNCSRQKLFISVKTSIVITESVVITKSIASYSYEYLLVQYPGQIFKVIYSGWLYKDCFSNLRLLKLIKHYFHLVKFFPSNFNWDSFLSCLVKNSIQWSSPRYSQALHHLLSALHRLPLQKATSKNEKMDAVLKEVIWWGWLPVGHHTRGPRIGKPWSGRNYLSFSFFFISGQRALI